jgi:agmatinase
MKARNVHFRGGYNFLGLPEEDSRYKDARAVILPVPYDSTTSYHPGTRNGPMALIAASRNVELYDIDLECEPLVTGIHTLPELEPDMSGPEATVKNVENAVRAICRDTKFPFMLGGEHSLTTGPVRVMQELYGKDVCVLQLDAHADLRERYENTVFNHASVMARAVDLMPVTQVGIRNISQGEMDWVKKTAHKGIFWAKDLQGDPKTWIPKIVKQLKKKVYITVDLDVFDSSIMPAVGTPEPGGMLWYPMVSLLETVIREREVVGMDVVELCPIPGFIAPDFLAAKLVFKMLATLFDRNGWIA